MLKEKSETVKVVVRCRPLSQREMQDQHECVVKVDPREHSIAVCSPSNQREVKNFTFDYTYDWNSTQEQVFNETALPILESVMQGYNGTIFAYGQTGTGKTFTMEGNDNERDKGINPRAIEWIFNNIKNYTNQQFLVRGSFVEIYNEEVRDLLSKNTKAKLNVREKDKVFYLEDVTVFQAENANRMIDIMKAGRVNRATGATKMNPGSSRSHSIFSIIVEASSVDESGQTHYRVGKLNLVDLAGSERQSKTESTGERFKEATKINLSLTILGSVINKLVSGKTQYIPYRDSKLTMLLQDSLGGNTKTVMIANVGPADYNYDETLNTLWYASHAKKIKNKPRINEDPKDALLRQYQEEIELMKKQLLALGQGELLSKITGGKIPAGSSVIDEEAQVRAAFEKIEKERKQFSEQYKSEIEKVKLQKNMAEEEKKKLLDDIQRKAEMTEKNKQEETKLLADYEEKRKMVLNGRKTDKILKDQEKEIIQNQIDLEAKRRDEERLREELESKSKQRLELQEKYNSKKDHIIDLDKNIAELRKRIEKQKKDNKDLDEQLQRVLEEYDEGTKGLTIEKKKHDFIIEKFIPQEEKERLLLLVEYDKKKGKCEIDKRKAIVLNYKTNLGAIKEMRKMKLNNQSIPQINQNLINLKLEMPEPLCKEEEDPEVMEKIAKNINNVLRDDDSTQLYYDKSIKMLTPTLTPEILELSSRKIDSRATTSSSTDAKKPVIKK